MKIPLLTALVFLVAAPLMPQTAPEGAIKAVLTTQVECWNRGDIPAFVNTYADDCIFVGKQITHGRAQLLRRYKRDYPNKAAMGHLQFSSLAVHVLDEQVAMVTAEWHLERSATGGGPVGGVFSLVLHREKSGWKIALDHTS